MLAQPGQTRAVLWWLVLVTAGCGRTPEPALIETGGEPAHRAACRAALATAGPSAKMFHALAASYWRTGHLDSSQTYLEEALAVEPHHVESLTWLSRLYYEQGKVEEGIGLLGPVVDSLPEIDPEVQTNLAVLLLAYGDFEAAALRLDRCAEHFPDYAPAYGNRGFLHMQEDNFEAAERALRRAVALDSNVPEFHNNLGILSRRQHEFAEAAKHFQDALDLDPNFLEAHHNLALLYKLYLGDEVGARRHFRNFLALGGNADGQVVELFRLEESP